MDNNKNDPQAAIIDILIVEDSETQANQLAYLLSSNGYHVRVAKNGNIGLQEARAAQPNLIISDIAMPEMDGFEMCRVLKKDSLLQHIPVILVTSLTSLYDVIKGLECGADNFIRKPYEEKYLLGRIRFILANREFRSNERVQLGMRINLGGQTHFVTAERQQIFDLLISTYEEAIHMTEELRHQQKLISQSYQSIEGLYQTAATLNLAITEKEVVERALERLEEFPGVFGAGVKLIKDNSVFRMTENGTFTSAVHAIDRCFDCSCDKSFASGPLRKPMLVSDCPLLSALPESSVTARKVLSAPLTLGQQTLGMMNLVVDTTVIGGEEDLQVINTVANQIAVALERANLYSNMESMVRERTEALYAERNLSSAVVNTTGALVLLINPEGRIVLFNPACEKNLGWKFSEVQDQVFWNIFLSPERAHALKEIFQRLQTTNFPLHIQDDWITKDKSVRNIIWSTNYLRKADQSIEYILATGIDVTDLRDAEQKVQYLRNFDSLTGLPNRFLLQGGLQLLQERAASEEKIIGFMMIDCARMPLIRETLGSKAEQSLLLEITERLKTWECSVDKIARIGDSSFALVAPRNNAEELAIAARQVLALFDQPYTVDEQELHLEAGIGITIFPEDGNDFDTLAKGAEAAMRSVFNEQNARYKFYKPELNRSAYERFKLENALRRALERSEFAIHYQPQIDLQTGSIVGIESLVRWQHPELGMIPPNEFISVAEESGLIIPLGEWALCTACAQLKAWHDQGHTELRVAVNLSARQFAHENLGKLIREILTETGLEARHLDLELTESMIMADVERAVAILNELNKLGVQISIDDFGTGYSSLAHLKRFPIDVLKIDRSFIREIPENSNDVAIADAIISMAHSLGMRVIAEGVETEAQCELLSRNICDEIQGFFFSKPVPANEMELMLNEKRCLPDRLLRLQKPARTLLLVDDDPSILSALRRQLRNDDYEILTATDGQKGLELLAHNKIDVIVSDQRMPGMTGVEFLRKVKILHPDTVRIVLSGFTELQSVTDAVNEGAIYKFLTKPWDDVQLREHVAEAFQHKEMVDENRRLNIEVRTANQELASANRQLEELVQHKQQQIYRREVSLDIVREALQHVPLPVIGLDEDNIIVFTNIAANDLFKNGGALLGNPGELFIPALSKGISEHETEEFCTVEIGGKWFEAAARRMGHGTQSRGSLIIFTPKH